MRDPLAMGVYVFLASLSTLIGAAVVGYVVIRLRSPTWPSIAPHGLWASTVTILLSSVAVHRAAKAAKRDDERALKNGLVLTAVFAACFLVSQAVNGYFIAKHFPLHRTDLFAFTFFMLVSLHAVHVLGGYVPLAITTYRAFRGRYGTDNCKGVHLLAVYWHFVDVVWIVMFVLLMV